MISFGRWGSLTVSSPREMDPTNFRVETVRVAIIPELVDKSIVSSLMFWLREIEVVTNMD